MGNRPANGWIEWKDKSGNTLDFVYRNNWNKNIY